MREWFRRFAHTTAALVGSVPAFIIAVLIIVVWLVTGPAFHFSDTWQLVINTGTTVITFLIVFLIQNTQNRETRALNLKVDELLRAVEAARTGFVHLEELSDQELDRLQSEFEKLGGKIVDVRKRKSSTGTTRRSKPADEQAAGKAAD